MISDLLLIYFRNMITKFLKKIRSVLPWSSHIIKYLNYQTYFDFYLILTAGIRHQWAFKKAVRQPKIKIVFFAIHRTIWKYDQLYRLFEQSERFEPVIVVCPYIVYGEELMLKEMASTYSYLSAKNFNVVSAYNAQSGRWIDVKKEIRPGILFFTDPHKLTMDEFYITNYRNYLTCYLPYTYQISNLYEVQYNQLFHNLIWKIFSPTPLHREIARKYARNKGRNIVVTGYAGTDVLQQYSYLPNDSWNIKDRNIKRIIWAPHHTIDNDTSYLAYSNFIKYHRIMLDIASDYIGKVQFAFKPHPLLKGKLYSENDWGTEKTNAYYKEWENLPNGQLEESDYADLFITSDAMVHDSSSFMAEYLAVNKPVLYTIRDQKIADRFNAIGKMAFEQHYHATNADGITKFIEDVVVNGNDIKRRQREAFVLEYLKPPYGLSATMNIYKIINQETLKVQLSD